MEMRQTSAQIYDFPAPSRVTVARPRAPFIKLARDYEHQLHQSRQQIRYAALCAGACGALALMAALCAYLLFVSAILAHSLVVWSFATAMLIVGGFFVYLGWWEYRDYQGKLSLYRGAVRHGGL
jgi:hypothetical protein